MSLLQPHSHCTQLSATRKISVSSLKVQENSVTVRI
ncbi:hypothetical protein HHX47_DHR7000397 [Lentinula edodes]|nr:hypothetical protein HHX47_DHR7000397 [Lentinula edodes]